MDWNRVIFFFLLFVLATTILSVHFTKKNEYPLEADSSKLPEGCEKFNGKNFLLSGGSEKTTTYEESIFELRRLSWLCSGGQT